VASGGAREGAGRKKKDENDKVTRPQHQVRAFDDEWDLIKRFSTIVKSGRIVEAEKVLIELEKK